MTVSPRVVLAILMGLLLLWSGFATWKWASAGARCDARVATLERDAATEAEEAARRAGLVAAGIFESSMFETQSALARAAAGTQARHTVIERVVTTGACTMPAGLPPLQPAVEEARNAARFD